MILHALRTSLRQAWIPGRLLLGMGLLFCLPNVNAHARTQPSEAKIEAVEFTGNTVFTDKRLKQIMISRPSTLFRSFYYYPELLQDDLRQLELFYQANGYLQAQVVGYQVNRDDSRNRVSIHIQIVEGPITSIEGISFFGNRLFSEEKLRSVIDVKVGDALRRQVADNSVYDLLHLYAEQGYLEARILPEISVDSDRHLALVDYVVKEGRMYYVGNLELSGLDKTRQRAITRELQFKPGEVIQYSKLLESQRQLYLTGLFESVFIKPDQNQDASDSLRVIHIDVHEALDKELNFRFGFNTIEKLRGGFEAIQSNLGGMGRRATFRSQLSFISRSLEIAYSEPWTFGSPWRTDAQLFTDYREEPGYDALRVGGSVSVGHKLRKNSRITFSYRLENVELRNIRVLDETGEGSNRIRLLRINLTYDTRNNIFNPTRGFYAEWSNDLAGLFFPNSSQFTRSIYSLSGYHSLLQSTVLASGLEVGWMDANRGLVSIPLNERLYTGGPNSVRGFEYQRLGPRDAAGTPSGGRLRIVLHPLEIRQNLYKVIGAALFIDAGNVWSRISYLRPSELRLAPGFGLRANTPIGLARLEYGFNLNPGSNEPPGQLYFSIGQAF
ncbi:MAG: outer membrane protein assembly factor BamA [bacterium]